jgi:hypothetical protein
MNFTVHLHVVPRLRMSGAVPLLPLCAFMVWTGQTLPVPLPYPICSFTSALSRLPRLTYVA